MRVRRRGWSFPPLKEARAKWEKRYPNWAWRDLEVTEWRPEELKEGSLEEGLEELRLRQTDELVLSLLEKHQVEARLDRAPARLAKLAKNRAKPEDVAAALQRLLTGGKIRVDGGGMLEIAPGTVWG
jgi:hypothetical protein